MRMMSAPRFFFSIEDFDFYYPRASEQSKVIAVVFKEEFNLNLARILFS